MSKRKCSDAEYIDRLENVIRKTYDEISFTADKYLDEAHKIEIDDVHEALDLMLRAEGLLHAKCILSGNLVKHGFRKNTKLLRREQSCP